MLFCTQFYFEVKPICSLFACAERRKQNVATGTSSASLAISRSKDQTPIERGCTTKSPGNKVGNSVQPGWRENKGFGTQAVWPKREIAEEGKTQDGYQRRLPGGENSGIGECLPRGKVGSSLFQNTGNQTEQNSSLSAAGRNPALKRMAGITRKAVPSI